MNAVANPAMATSIHTMPKSAPVTIGRDISAMAVTIKAEAQSAPASARFEGMK